MDFSKIPHPVNFKFRNSVQSKKFTCLGNGFFRLQISFGCENPRPFKWNEEAFRTNKPSKNFSNRARFSKGNFQVFSPSGKPLLESAREGFFGTCQNRWLMRFEASEDFHFYGLGERAGKLDRKGTRAQMWNVDAWGAHGTIKCRDDEPDPLYANIPFLLIRKGEDAVGILVNDAGRVFFSLSPDMRLHPSQEPVQGSSLYFGSTSGPADVLFIVGNDAADVISKLGKLTSLRNGR